MTLNQQVIVWGHSLGTAISTRALVNSNFTQVSLLIMLEVSNVSLTNTY